MIILLIWFQISICMCVCVHVCVFRLHDEKINHMDRIIFKLERGMNNLFQTIEIKGFTSHMCVCDGHKVI